MQYWERWHRRWWFIAVVQAGILAAAAVDAIPYGTSGWTWDWTWSLVAVAGLLVRWRWGLLSWAACLPGLFLGDVLVAPLVAVFSVADRVRRGWLVIAVGLGTFGIQLAGSVRYGFGSGQLALLQNIVYALVYSGGPAAAGLLSRARGQITTQLMDLTASSQREQELATASVLAEERARLAREMHDVVSHQVSLIALQAAAWRVTADSESSQQAATTIRKLAVHTLEELRAMVGVLRASAHLELAPQPRLADLARLVAESETGAQLQWDIDQNRSWPEAVERAAYRTVQEGLTNVRKHAPGADAEVDVHDGVDSLTVTVHNGPTAGGPGVHRPLPGGGHGLIGLRERAELLGGTLRAGPTNGGGYTLTVTLRQLDHG